MDPIQGTFGRGLRWLSRPASEGVNRFCFLRGTGGVVLWWELPAFGQQVVCVVPWVPGVFSGDQNGPGLVRLTDTGPPTGPGGRTCTTDETRTEILRGEEDRSREH